MENKIWRTKDKRLIPISEMETRHINNCIRLILRSGKKWRGEYLERLKLELVIRQLNGQ